MMSKVNTLQKNIQEVKKKNDDYLSQYPIYGSIDQSLKDLGETLTSGKLRLNIVSQDLEQAKTLQRLLMLNGKLQDSYTLKSFSLPKFSSFKDPSPTLVLQSTQASSPTSYNLKVLDSQIIGRNPASAQILLPDSFSLVSGSHAEIRCINNEWQVRDLNSRNGTFINDNPQKLQDWHTLKKGDCIHLGSASQGLGSAALTFEIPSQSDFDLAQVETQKIVNCNILCLITSPQSIAEEIQQLLQVQFASISKLFFILDKSGNMPIEAYKEMNIEDSIKSQAEDTPFELIPLLLKPSTPTSGATVITPHAQPEFESFCQGLMSFSKENSETILTEWITVQLNQIVNQIEISLVQKDNDSKEQLQKAEAKFKELSQGNFKKTADKAYKKVDGERDLFFRQVKTELGQSKANFLDEHRQSSISYKIQQFTKQLQSQVSDRGGYRYVCLTVTSGNTTATSTNDVHVAATKLCHDELTRWATAEWSRIQDEYGGGGLEALLERSYQSLNLLDLNIPKDRFSTFHALSIESILNVSNVEPTLESRYKQSNFWGYLSKTLRTNLMQIVAMVTMLGGGLIHFNKAMLIFPLIPVVGVCAYLSHEHEKEAKLMCI